MGRAIGTTGTRRLITTRPTAAWRIVTPYYCTQVMEPEARRRWPPSTTAARAPQAGARPARQAGRARLGGGLVSSPRRPCSALAVLLIVYSGRWELPPQTFSLSFSARPRQRRTPSPSLSQQPVFGKSVRNESSAAARLRRKLVLDEVGEVLARERWPYAAAGAPVDPPLEHLPWQQECR